MIRLSEARKKQEQEAERETAIYRRIAFAAALLLTIFNALLMLDVYALPIVKKTDYLKDRTSLHRNISSDDKITTSAGRKIFITNAYGFPGDTLEVNTTVIFDIVTNVWNSSMHYQMNRQLNGLQQAKIWSPLLFLLGLLSFLFQKKLRDHYPIFVVLTVTATAQCILMML